MCFIHRNGGMRQEDVVPVPPPVDPMTPRLTKLLTEDPYEVPAKKGKGEKKGRAKSMSSHHSSTDPSAEEEGSEEPSSKDGKRAAFEEVKEIIPPQSFKHPRKAHIGPTGQTLVAVETIDSSSSKDSPRPQERPEAKR